MFEKDMAKLERKREKAKLEADIIILDKCYLFCEE